MITGILHLVWSQCKSMELTLLAIMAVLLVLLLLVQNRRRGTHVKSR